MKWRGYNVSIVRFEDLVGEKGGESNHRQTLAIAQICNHLGIEISDEAVSEIRQRLFGTAGTFRKGVTGEWKKEFSIEHKNLMKELAGDLLIELGYEKNHDW